MKNLFPALGISILLHILLFSIFAVSFTAKPSIPQHAPIIVKLLSPPAIKLKPESTTPSIKKISPPASKSRKNIAQKQLSAPENPAPQISQKRNPAASVKNQKSTQSGRSKSSTHPVSKNKTFSKAETTNPILSMKQLLPEDLIAKTAQQPLEQAKKQSTASITFSTKKLKYESYMMRLKERIESIWVYPPEAIEKGIYGDLVIEFAIDKNGKLTYARVIRTSGFDILDEAALRALKEGQPYWPLPKSWHKNMLYVKGHFIYTLSGMYIR